MGLASRLSPGSQRIDTANGVAVIDTIAMKKSLGLSHAPGVVVVLDSFPSSDPQAFVGRGVRLRTPAGPVRAAQVEAVRDHGTTISFFFRGLTPADVPVGSRLEFLD